MNYNAIVKSYFFYPKHVGDLALDGHVLTHSSGQHGFSERVELFVQYNAQQVIETTKFKAQGSPYLIAAAEWLCRFLEGKPIAVLDNFDVNEMISVLDVPKTNMASIFRLKAVCHELYLKYSHESA